MCLGLADVISLQESRTQFQDSLAMQSRMYLHNDCNWVAVKLEIVAAAVMDCLTMIAAGLQSSLQYLLQL